MQRYKAFAHFFHPFYAKSGKIDGMEQFGRILIIIGVVMIVVGALLMLSGKLLWIGRLPGDIVVQKKNFTFYFPIATSILLSLLLTLIFWFIGRK